MKYYKHTLTMREQFILERRQARVQAGFDFLIVILTTIFMYILTIWALS
tara:strand:- start:897 stop:1043 length:147 start_codon:yes stop_codon:yes gene_type:complete